MKTKKRWLHLSLLFCLVVGWATYLPLASPGVTLAADPPPGGEENRPESMPALPAPPTPDAAQAELQAGLAALELALQQGPEAVLALAQTLRGAALDAAMNDIVAAQRQVARSAPPRPATAPVSPAEEEAALQAQAALDAASRAQAWAQYDAPVYNEDVVKDAGGQTPDGPNRPAADLTVGSAPCTYATINAAMMVANPGDRLLLEGGVVFTANLSIQKSLTFQGGYNGCGSGSSARTTINGNGAGRVMYIYDNLDIALENLNIINGDSTGNGAGIFVRSNTHVHGTNLEIYNNTSDMLGGGVRLWGGSATFTNTNIYDNVAVAGAGVYAELYNGYAPALNLPYSADVYDNEALTGSGQGGGVYMSQGIVTLTNSSDIYNNDAIEGGGVYMISSTLTIAGKSSEIMFNTATGNGGGIRAQGSTINVDEDAELYANYAGTDGTGSGGGAYLDNTDLWGDKALIYYNTADDYGGGVYATNSSLLDMDLGGYACSGPRCSQLSYNTAATVYGGGVYISESEIDLRQIFVENNTASLGGAIYAWRDPSAATRAVYAYNCLFARNDGGAADGIRLWTNAGQTTRMIGSHNTLAYNPVAGDGDAVAIAGAGTSDLNLSNSIVWGHTTAIPTGQTVTYSDIQGGYTGAGNMNIDPLFVAPASANFHLQSLSPVIDRCATGETVDFDNEARPLTHVRPATPYDMGADEAAARVGINGAACTYGSIQDAVDMAVSGDTIQAAADVFSETVVVGDRNLTIIGGYDVDCTTYITGTTTVNGEGAGSVFLIINSAVTLRNLDITGGAAGTGGGVSVWPGTSQVILDNTDVFGNQASHGGGVYIDVGNVLTLTNDSDIHHNTATNGGGGARVWGKLVGAETFSDITDNSAPDGGGVSVPGGTLVLRDSDMTGNQATALEGKGGGIHVYEHGVVTATGNAWIYNGHTAYDGGGIYADNARLYLNEVTIGGNTVTNNGGGLYLANASHLEAINVDLSNAGNGNEAVNGGGLYLNASTANFNGRIYNNVVTAQGGGLFANSGAITLTNTYVGGTGPSQGNRLSNSGNGAGLYLSGTHASLVNTVVASNTFPLAGWGYGGGLHLSNGCVVTLTESTVEQHYAPGAGSGRGAGLYIWNSTVTLDHSRVVSNTADGAGGGIRLYEGGVLDILNGSELRNNHALDGAGGAIAAADGTPDINIANATLQGNTASADGGAVYLDAGTLDFTGWWDVRDNVAGGNGGAVAVTGTGDADFNANGAGSSILYNQAGGNGGALYVTNDDRVQLYSTSGYLLSISGNQAGGNGGAAFGSGADYFDVYGRVIVTANSAGGNGGAFYLSDGKGVWLDDYFNDTPEVRANQAQNGGAIYAQDSPRVDCDGATLGYDPNGNQATAGAGGALYLSGSSLNADNCTFQNNAATGNGGAIAAYTSTLNIRATYSAITLAPERADGHALLAPQATECNPLTEQCSSFSGNVANSDGNADGYGGAIYVNDSTLNVNHTTLHRNAALSGGAIYQTGANAVGEVVNSLVYSNTVSTALGAGIRSSNGAFTVTHTTLANNVGGSGFSGVASAVSNTIAWGNDGFSGFAATPVISSCTIDNGGNAGLVINPQFVAPGAGENYRLLGSSPAINACATGLTPDLDNTTRPFDSVYDMGAYEYAYGVAFAPDRMGNGLAPSIVMYTHTLTNTGGTPDTFTLSGNSENGWDVTFAPAATVPLPGGAALPITVSLTIPDGVISGTVDTLVITATSGADPTLTANVTDTTTVFTSTLPLYTLTVNVDGNGSVTWTPSQTTYISGTVVQLEAFPDTDWVFAGWSGDLSGNSNPTDLTMNADAVVTATFTPVPSYTLTVNVVGNGSVTRTPSQTLHLSGTVVTLTAEPAVDWVFSGWSGDLLGSATPATITLDSNKVVTATFAAITHTLTTAVVGSGAVTRTPDQTAYVSGTVVTLEAVPAGGWQFSAWNGDLLGSANPATITLDSAKTVTATFTAIPTYTLTVNITGTGSVTRTPSQTTYLAGDVVTLTATPDGGWYFGGWSGDLNVGNNPASLTMDGDKVVTATFTTTPPPEYTLDVVVVGNGSVAKSPDAPAYIAGTVVQLTAEPDMGWRFSAWSGDLTSATNPDSLTMDGNKTVTVTFTPLPTYTLTINVVGNGSVTTAPSQTSYIEGSLVQLTAIPDASWYFATWNGDLSIANNPANLTMDGDKVVTATFSTTPPPSYTLAINVTGNGEVTRAPSETTYISGTLVQLHATPDAGWDFTAWNGDLTGAANPASLLMDGDKTVTATFDPLPVTMYTLTVMTAGTGSGVVNPPVGTHSYLEGTTVVLTATANAGSTFTAWSGDASGTAITTSVLMDGDKTVTATFALGTAQHYIYLPLVLRSAP